MSEFHPVINSWRHWVSNCRIPCELCMQCHLFNQLIQEMQPCEQVWARLSDRQRFCLASADHRTILYQGSQKGFADLLIRLLALFSDSHYKQPEQWASLMKVVSFCFEEVLKHNRALEEEPLAIFVAAIPTLFVVINQSLKVPLQRDDPILAFISNCHYCWLHKIKATPVVLSFIKREPHAPITSHTPIVKCNT